MVSARRWAGVLGVLGVVLGATWVARRPVAPLPASAAPEQFSEARALPLMRELAGELGPRPLGSPAAARAVVLLAERLRALPGVEVEVQDVTGTTVDEEGMLVLFRAVNVLARLSGEDADAVLLSAHFDSPEESPGAGDDAVAVAAGVEVMRALSAGPRLRRTVVLNLNGGEEEGRLGATAFLGHPWARDVKGFINLEAVGVGGRLVLFRASPGAAALVEGYAATAPAPRASVLGQDVMASGVAPFYTDFEQYVGAGLPGLDLALVEGGHVYHTALDRPEAVPAGTLQHVGDTALALVRGFASAPRVAAAHGAPTANLVDARGLASSPPVAAVHEAAMTTFFDVLGLGTVVYGPRAATAMTVVAVVLFVAAGAVAMRRGGLTWRGWGRGFLWTGVGGALGLLLPVLSGLLVGVVLRRPQGWYATPWLGVVTFGVLTLAGVLLGEALWAKRAARRGSEAPRNIERWAGALAWGAAIVVLGTWGSVGVTYALLVWLVGGAMGLLVATRVPRWRGAVLGLAFIPGLVLMSQAASLLLSLVIPLTGHLLVPFPLDGAVALLVALPTVAGAWLVADVFPWADGGRPVLTGALVLALGGLLALALVAPHDEAHPRRLRAVERTDASGRALVLQSMDGLALGPMVPELAEAHATQAQTALALSEQMAKETSGLAAPVVTVEHVAQHGPEREVSLRLTAPAGAALRLEVPREALASWSLGSSLPNLPADATAFRALALSPPAEGWRVGLRLRGTAPVPLRVRASREGAVTSSLEALRRSLGPSTTGSFAASHTVEARP
ncbi:M28 family peptidase [Myxococcus stipitatus DSM 14675]|uniref:Vacuolar membrane protease n=1 Tax=Myxococcus stipitatus (strain DSM 14675 / JCM 12634 / Mx s8) TaxID=1278073 RepID=L7UHT6_MYXSD|nr:M28 family peptidase [Myxococcus stipitatus]AGC47420.1 M28 family peptidase [Myxococcus stipitatus DSM 14675]